MATLFKRKDRKAFYLSYIDPTDGKRYKVNTGVEDKQIADHWRIKAEELVSKARMGLISEVGRIDADVVSGRKDLETSPLLSKFKEMYEERCRYDLELSEKTIEANNTAIDSLTKCLGDVKIENVTQEDVLKWKRWGGNNGLSRTSQGIYHRHPKAAWNKAIYYGWMRGNPFALVQITRTKKQDRPSFDMSMAEVKKVIQIVEKGRKDAKPSPRIAQFFRVLLYTASRRKDALHIKWEDIDWKEKTLAYWNHKGSRWVTIPISPALETVLQEIGPKDEGFVFTSDSRRLGKNRGKVPWYEDTVSHKFKQAVRALKLPDHYKLHSLRHTYSTFLRSKGVPLDIAQKLLGHSSITVTAEHYDHSVAVHFRQYADMVDLNE